MDISFDDFHKWWIYFLTRPNRSEMISLTESCREIRVKDITEEGISPETVMSWSRDYSGPKELRERIIDSQGYEDITTDNVIVTTGTNEANMLAALAVLEPGDEVILESPQWMQGYAICKHIFHAHIKILYLKEENSWKPIVEELNDAVTSKTKLIWLCHPNNPTGSVLNQGEMRAICEIARDSGAWVLQDEIYRNLEWNDIVSPSVVNFYDKGITTAGLSKTLGVEGMRIGWLACKDSAFVEKCNVFRVYTTLTTNILGEKLATIALQPEKFQKIVGMGKRIGRTNIELVDQWIKNHNASISWVPPGGSYNTFPKYHYNMKSLEFCKRALDYNIIFTPGGAFPGGEGHIRLGIAINTDQLKEGLSRFDAFLKSLKSL